MRSLFLRWEDSATNSCCTDIAIMNDTAAVSMVSLPKTRSLRSQMRENSPVRFWNRAEGVTLSLRLTIGCADTRFRAISAPLILSRLNASFSFWALNKNGSTTDALWIILSFFQLKLRNVSSYIPTIFIVRQKRVRSLHLSLLFFRSFCSSSQFHTLIIPANGAERGKKKRKIHSPNPAERAA